MDIDHTKMRWKGTIVYDGTGLHGWQSQPGGNTVQDFLEARLEGIFKCAIRVHGSGRTDAGVHAKGQVFHFDAHWPHTPAELLRALRSGLPSGIQVTRISRVSADFHARFSAVGKRYEYRFYEGYALPWDARYCWSLGNRRLNTAAMAEAAANLLGEHDFAAFGANRGDGSEDDPVKIMRRMDVIRNGRKVRFVTEGSGYLYKMVRSFAGTLAQVGFGKLTPTEVAAILESRKRTRVVETAPAQGLWLDRVYYR